jgi:DNA repair exonuclease SbcCD ATPase subunit
MPATVLTLRSVFGHAKAWAPAFLAAAMLVACSDEQKSVLQSKVNKVIPESKKKTEQPDGGWTPEKIAANPTGYLQYATRKVDSQIQGRKSKLAQLGQQKTDIESRAGSLNGKVTDAENIIKRMKTAMQRADDENNWPVKMAGRTFDQAKCDAVIKSLEQFVADRQSLVTAYADAMNRINGAVNTMTADIENLTRMREKIGLDLERVRLNQNIAEIGDLNKTETELAAFAKTLADMSDDSSLVNLGSLVKTNEALNAESLLR